MPGDTLRLHRVLKAPPARVYQAFIDPAAMCKWLPPYGFTGTVHKAEARVGGEHRMSFTSFSTGAVTFKAVSCGTELSVLQEGVPEAIPPEMCYLGWQESLAQLARLVEPEIRP